MQTRLLTLYVALALAAGAGCATRQAVSGPDPRNGIAEYKKLASEALEEVQASLKALDSVAASNGRKSERTVTGFSEAVQKLQVKSQAIRAHAQAMETRGDAYFADWEENLASMNDARLRKLASQHHEDLQQAFQRIKFATHDGRAAFRAYLAGLRNLSIALEKDPASLGADGNSELIRSTKENGLQVKRQLELILGEVRCMATELTPGKN
jgi:hypothetical protein